MDKQEVGKVSEKEKNEILILFQRKLALRDLKVCVSDNNDFKIDKDKIITDINKDLEENEFLLKKWWEKKYRKYGWQSKIDKSWAIDFETNKIYLVD